MKNHSKSVLAAGILLGTLSLSAQAAFDAIVGKVTRVEATYMPNSIYFQMNAGTSNCAAGSWFRWAKSTANNEAAYALLLTAAVSGKEISFLVDQIEPNGDGLCDGSFLYFNQ
ncbi:MAG: hypothetical protein ACFHX7_00230 [Pseudomonadota bacterium]